MARYRGKEPIRATNFSFDGAHPAVAEPGTHFLHEQADARLTRALDDSVDAGGSEFSHGSLAARPDPDDPSRMSAEYVSRLEAELAKLRTHNEALRRQMRAVQAASFEDVAVIPPSDPAEADAMRRAEEEAHRLGADGAAADAAALLKAIDALRVAASQSSGSVRSYTNHSMPKSSVSVLWCFP